MNVKFKMAESSDNGAEYSDDLFIKNINKNTGIAQKYCEIIINKTFGYWLAQFF